MRALRALSCLMRTTGLLAIAVMGLALCGCSGSQSKPVPVTGQVLFAGKPLANAHVALVPVGDKAKEEAPRPVGTTDAQGRFALSTFKEKDGAPTGEYAVLVQWFPLVPRPGREVERGPNALPSRYADPRQTPLRVTVEKTSSELTPLEVARR